MTINYFRYFFRVGIPISIFLTLFFALLLGIKEGLFPGLLMGLVVGGVLSFILSLLYSGAVGNLMSDWRKDLKDRPFRPTNLIQIAVPLFIVLLGALITRLYGHAAVTFLLTVLLSLIGYMVVSLYIGDFMKAIQEKEIVSYIMGIVTWIIPFSLVYFIFLFIMVGFDSDKIKNLF
jgi:hypothetical protein